MFSSSFFSLRIIFGEELEAIVVGSYNALSKNFPSYSLLFKFCIPSLFTFLGELGRFCDPALFYNIFLEIKKKKTLQNENSYVMYTNQHNANQCWLILKAMLF